MSLVRAGRSTAREQHRCEPELDCVADDLRQFLELLEQVLTRFARATNRRTSS